MKNNINTCKDCKYFNSCGDLNRVEPCNGYERKAVTMKTYKQIEKEIQKTRAEIEQLSLDLEAIERKEERRAEAKANNIERLREISESIRENADTITAICDKIYLNKITLAVLRDCYKAAVVAQALPIIAEETAKFNGKSYGEKTRDKIREQVKQRGFWFYIGGHNNDTLTISVINDHGYSCGDDCKAYAPYSSPFLTSDNKLSFDPSTVFHYYKYTENPKKAAREIIKAYETYKKDIARAYKAQNAFNDLLPENISGQHNITREPYSTLL